MLLDSEKSQNSVLVSTKKGNSKLDSVGKFVDLKDKEKAPSRVKRMSQEKIKSRFAKALAASPEAPLKYILYFQPNSTALTEASEKSLLDAIASIAERSPCMVDIIGHTDTVGSSELNIKVSLKRANHIKSVLEGKGVEVVSLTAKGYGEEDLQVKTADNVDEAKNRNVEIFIK
ncbi:MAG: OmpA family protein [Epsilonproteobacteria bacterium]|nr:OmpA family protein [Campylobacterota bacterium]